MREQTDILPCTQAGMNGSASEIVRTIKCMSKEQLKSLLKCNDEIVKLNFERYTNMDLEQGQTPALLAYDGIQYKYMAPLVMEQSCFDYLQSHLIILSGLYGGLRPYDGVVSYRLEMQAKLGICGYENLYKYWGDSIYNTYLADEDVVLNLASNEYAIAVKKYLKPNQAWVDVSFGELIGGKVVEKGVYVKMARGEMASYMATNNVTEIEKIKKFNRLGFVYNNELSTKEKYVFIKGE